MEVFLERRVKKVKIKGLERMVPYNSQEDEDEGFT